VEAETMLKKLLEFDPNNESIAAEQKDLAYVQRFLKDAEAAYTAKDYRKVKIIMTFSLCQITDHICSR